MGVSGYKQIYMPDYWCASKTGFVAEHRYVAEQKLGRHLKRGEVVHHIDRDRKNNDPDNLIVFHTKEDHNRFHNGGTLEQIEDGSYISRKEKPKRACEYCGRIFTPNTADRKYCCHECATLAKRKYEKPARAQLRRLLIEFSVTQIATIYGVPNQIVLRWCMSYRLPYKLKDLKRLRENEMIKEENKRKKAEEKRRQQESDRIRRQNEGD